jgi:molecular chaperone DnaK
MMRVGIDLGTTYSIVSGLNMHGVPAVFPDAHDANEFRTPSVVVIAPFGCLVGNAAEDMLDDEPDLPYVRFAKLKMASGADVLVDHKGNKWSAEAISALILRKVAADASSFSGEDVDAAVITVPAQFGDRRRRATRNAALMAGIKELRLVDEPVAAATYYGVTKKKIDQTLFVYDLGGGTFDATVLHCSPDGLYVLATEGSESLGGKHFDETIAKVATQGIKEADAEAIWNDPPARNQLLRFAEKTKVKLCKPGPSQVKQTLLLANRVIDFMLTRNQFEKLIAPRIEETMQISQNCLKGAGLSWDSIDHVLMAGGSSLIPYVRRQLCDASGKPADDLVARQPHQAIAFGAALIANENSGFTELEMPQLKQKIAPFDLGLRVKDPETGEPTVQVLIERNTPIPVEHTGVYYTTAAEQTQVFLDIVERKGIDACAYSLGCCSFGPLPNPRINRPVEITVAYDEEAILSVKARDPDTGQEIEHRIGNEHDEDDAAWLSSQRDLVRRQTLN